MKLLACTVSMALGSVLSVGCGNSITQPTDIQSTTSQKPKTAEEERARLWKQQADAIRRVFADSKIIYGQREADYNARLAKTNDSEESARIADRRAATRMRDVDLVGCPAEFQQTFLEVINAMDAYVQLSDDYAGMAGTIGGLIEYAVGRSNPADRFAAAKKRQQEAATKMQVIALQYGVQLK